MTARILMADEAVDRLAELGLSVDLVERVVRRADAEASFCTPLDPPIMEGLTRWGRTNRFLREELIPPGWSFDNPRNLPRTIHPSGEFAIVATTGMSSPAWRICCRRPSTRKAMPRSGRSRSTGS